MNEQEYQQLLEDLGFDTEYVPMVNMGRLLRLRRSPDEYFEPRMYWSLSKQGLIYFTTPAKNQNAFSADFWEPAEVTRVKPSDRKSAINGIYLNLVPIAGREREAFLSLL